MKANIETYRGFDITFDTEKHTFSAWSDTWDTEFAKKSYAAVKKGVDDHLKANASFRPFRVQQVSSYGDRFDMMAEPILITGMRKDGVLTYEEDGKKKRISRHDEKRYRLYAPSHEDVKMQFDAAKAELESARTQHAKKIKALEPLLNDLRLSDYAKELREGN